MSGTASSSSADSGAGKSILFLGATGYIGGSALSAILVATPAPGRVTVLVRSADKGKLLEELPLPVPSASGAGAGGGTSIKALVGSMQDHELVVAAAADADVIVNTANADDLTAVKSLLEGMRRRKAQTGHRTVYIHTSGTGVLADDARGEYASDVIYTDMHATPATAQSPALRPISSIPSSAPHRAVDEHVMAADSAGDVKAYIVIPSTIWGSGAEGVNGKAAPEIYTRGIANTFSDQMPTLARIALDRRRAGVVGKGANIWPHVRITDLGSLYALVYAGALRSKSKGDDAPSPIGHGPENGFYLGISGEYTLLAAATAIGQALVEQRLVPEDQAQPTSLTPEEVDKYFAGSYYSGSNSRGRAARSRSIGWSPRFTDERDFLQDVKAEVARVQAHFGSTWDKAKVKHKVYLF